MDKFLSKYGNYKDYNIGDRVRLRGRWIFRGKPQVDASFNPDGYGALGTVIHPDKFDTDLKTPHVLVAFDGTKYDGSTRPGEGYWVEESCVDSEFLDVTDDEVAELFGLKKPEPPSIESLLNEVADRLWQDGQKDLSSRVHDIRRALR